MDYTMSTQHILTFLLKMLGKKYSRKKATSAHIRPTSPPPKPLHTRK